MKRAASSKSERGARADRRSFVAALCGCALLVLPPPVCAAADDDSLYALPMSFRTDNGRPVKLADWRGRPAVIAMDHTQSLVVCSDTIRRMRAVETAATRLGVQLDYIVLGLDPQADTPDAWQRYKRFFGVDRPRWHFLNAGAEETAKLVDRLGIKMTFEQGYRFHEVKLFRVDAAGRVLRTLEGYDRDTERFLK